MNHTRTEDLRRIALSVCMMSMASMSAIAQTNTHVTHSQKDSLNLQLFGGINKSANENMPWKEFTGEPLSGGAYLGIGSEFSRLWGWRVTLGIDGNKSRNVPKCESSVTWSWCDLEGWADATFDITDVFKRSNANASRFNLKAFVGIGGLYTFGFPKEVPLSYTMPYSKNSTINLGVRAGLLATYKVAERWKVGLELSHLMANDRFNGVVGGFGMDGRTNLMVGVTYTIAKKAKRQTVFQKANRLDKPMNLELLPINYVDGEKTFEVSGVSYLDFPVNETVIYNDYHSNSSELRRIHETIEKPKFNSSIEIAAIKLHGYASPESSLSNNTRLAKGRVAALAQHLQRYYNLPHDIIHQEYTPEDWKKLREYVSEEKPITITGEHAPQMPEAVKKHRAELLHIINTDIDLDAKEEKLKEVAGGEPYKWLLNNIYPRLRHTDYTITYKAKAYDVQEGRRLIYSHPEAMSITEMYNVAKSYARGTDGWYDAITIAAERFADNETARYNAAVASIETHRLRDARRYLQDIHTNDAEYLRLVIGAMEGSIDWKLSNDGKLIKK